MLRPMPLLISFGLISGVAVAQDQQAIRDQIFGDTDAVKARADALDAERLAPTSYAEGMELYLEAGDRVEEGRDIDRAREELDEAQVFFQASIEAAELALITFEDALDARAAAGRANAASMAEREWSRAEEDLIEAASRLEDGNMRRAQDIAADAEERYREAEAEAINNQAKADAG